MDAETDPTRKNELKTQYEEAAKWEMDGQYRLGLTVIAGAAGGNVTGGAGQFVQAAVVNYLQALGASKVKEIADALDNEAARAALQGLVGCAGAAGQGGSCSAGATGAAASVVLNNLIQRLSATNADKLSAEEKDTHANLVASLVAGLSVALGGESSVATLAAKIETENNYFGQKPERFSASEQQQFNEAMAICGPGNTDGCARARELAGISEQRDKELASACIDPASSLCRAAVQLATATGNVVFFDKQGKPTAVPTNSPIIQATPDPRDGTWHYTIAASVAEGLAIDATGFGLAGAISLLRGSVAAAKAEALVVPKGIGGTVDGTTTGIKWGVGIQEQGMPWENYLASQMSASSRLSVNFKTFDFYEAASGTAISAKTLDTTTAAKLANPGQIYSSLKGNIDSAAKFESYTLGNFSLNGSMINTRELRVAVPSETTSAQWVQINKAIEYGKSQGVKVTVTEVK
ncbi:hypothetical protein D3C86_1034890 [compost metagenome]